MSKIKETIARSVALAIRAMDSIAFTLEGGYAIAEDGTRSFFPTGSAVKQRRNERGRVTFAEYAYVDGSVLTYRWHPDRGYRLG